MTEESDSELAKRLRASALTQAEYQKTETERQLKLAEAAEYESQETGGGADQEGDRLADDET